MYLIYTFEGQCCPGFRIEFYNDNQGACSRKAARETAEELL